MKKISNSFQNGTIWIKLVWVVGIALGLIVGWIIIQSVMFFLQTTIGFIGLVLWNILVRKNIMNILVTLKNIYKENGKYEFR